MKIYIAFKSERRSKTSRSGCETLAGAHSSLVNVWKRIRKIWPNRLYLFHLLAVQYQNPQFRILFVLKPRSFIEMLRLLTPNRL